MKKILSFLFCIAALILMLTACAPEGWTYSPASQTPSLSASATPSASQTKKPAPTQTPSPSPGFIPDTDIPDVVTGKGPAADSSRTVYEDEKNVYILITSYGPECLYRIDKIDNSAQIISFNCNGFTMLGGKIFYIDYDARSGCYNTLKSFDTSSKKVKQILKLKYGIYNVAAYKEKLYFVYAPEHNEELEADISNLYSINPNGKNTTVVAKDVDTFIIYNDILYYTEPGYPDGAPLYMCKLDNKRDKTFIDWTWDYTILNGKLFFNRDEENAFLNYLCEIDLSTQKVTKLSLGLYDYIPFGQYLISVEIDETAVCGISYLQAFDTENGDVYKLLELGTEEYYTLNSSQDRAYISWHDGDRLHISEITISGGRASLNDNKFVVSELDSIEYKQPSTDTVIIASGFGYICGGYSGGKWLTHSEAAAYCGGNIIFNKCNLKDCIGTVKSSGVQFEDGDGSCVSRTYVMPAESYDQSGFCTLNIPENETDYDYSKDPLCYSYLYYGASLPKIEAISDTSKIQPIIQKIVDEHLGKGNVDAKIRTAVKADIDGDGKEEIVVNADNNAEEFEDSDDYLDYSDDYLDVEAGEKYWFCLCCIIESDGSVVIIDKYFARPSKEDEYNDMDLTYVQNIIDIDGDGDCEIVLDWNVWEASNTVVYKYNGQKLKEAMVFSFGS